MVKRSLAAIKIFAFSLALTIVLFAPVALAQDEKDVADLYMILGGFYNKLLLPIGTVLAGLVIMFGGISYAASAGDPTKAQNAKSYIFGAISGLVLLILASLIIQTISK